MNTDIAVLFARKNSVYKTLGCDVYDKKRDATTFMGGKKVIAHPPCRAWGRYKKVSKHTHLEKNLALWAMCEVRLWGGVLEHPASSRLWQFLEPGDETIVVDQHWWGHRSQKRTRLFYKDCEPGPLPLSFHPEHPVELMGKAEREGTPMEFAKWLIEMVKA